MEHCFVKFAQPPSRCYGMDCLGRNFRDGGSVLLAQLFYPRLQRYGLLHQIGQLLSLVRPEKPSHFGLNSFHFVLKGAKFCRCENLTTDMGAGFV